MTKKTEERTAAREFCLARMAACRGSLASACAALDEALILFIDTDEDAKGKQRSELLEAVDASIGDAARAIQAAMPSMEDLDPKEGEPDVDDDDDDIDEEDLDDDED